MNLIDLHVPGPLVDPRGAARTPIAPDGSCDHFLELRENDTLADLPPEEA